MLNENIKKLRKAKGISQEELAIRLNVVRQTVSKWENGLSVPDSAMLIRLAEELNTTVSTLLGETVAESGPDGLQALAEKLEAVNLRLARQSAARTRAVRIALTALCVLAVAGFAAFAAIGGSYLDWDYGDPEAAVAGTILHGIEFVFVRAAPFVFLASAAGLILTFRRKA